VRNLLITLVIALVACVVAYGVSFALSDNRAMHAAVRQGDAMAWLRVEFRLTDAQYEAVRKLHEDYSVICGEHCAAIMEARERRAPVAEVTALEKFCVDAMKGHFRRVAALMPPEQGERYLAMVLPRIAGYTHQGAPNVRVSP
jgi:hypothetical protein